MTAIDSHRLLDRAARERRLLDHPYYRAWQSGELSIGDLAEYAAQYRHVERCLPATLEAASARLPAGRARDMVEANLADELSQPRPHLELFEDFAAAVGADADVAATPATARLIATYEQAAAAGPAAALAVIGAYEVQADEVAATKALSLRAHYGLDEVATRFWDVHAQLEASHADWTSEAIEGLDPATDEISQYAGASAAAWWAFLDEREAARA